MGDYIETPANPGADDGRCANHDCRASGLTEEEHRCHGCGYLVCESCDAHGPMGKHLVVAHWEGEE